MVSGVVVRLQSRISQVLYVGEGGPDAMQALYAASKVEVPKAQLFTRNKSGKFDRFCPTVRGGRNKPGKEPKATQSQNYR
jgi:hypothetical protein